MPQNGFGQGFGGFGMGMFPGFGEQRPQRQPFYQHNGPLGNQMLGANMNFGNQMQGAMGQMGAQLNANADRQMAGEMAGVPLQLEGMRQQGQTNRLGMMAPLFAALFGGSLGGGGRGGQGGNGGFMTGYGQYALPGGMMGGGQAGGGGQGMMGGGGEDGDGFDGLSRFLAQQRYIREVPFQNLGTLIQGGFRPGAVV